LFLSGRVSAILTEDSDCLAYLSDYVVLHWSREEEEMVSTTTAANALNLSPSQFQDLCVLLGNDFNARLKGIGPVKAFALIQKYHSLEGVLSACNVLGDVATGMRQSRHIFETVCFEANVQ
jgi:flap endonuclease-1